MIKNLQRYYWIILISLFQITLAFSTVEKPADPFHFVLAEYSAVNIYFGNGNLELLFNRETGAWEHIRLRDRNIGYFFSPSGFTEDVQIDNHWLRQENKSTFRNHLVAEDTAARTISMVYDIQDKEQHQFELISHYKLYNNKMVIERSAELRYIPKSPTESCPVKFQNFRFSTPGISIGEPTDWTVTIPGPFFPNSYIPPQTPSAELVAKNITIHSSPCAGFGLLTMTNPVIKLSIGSWMDTKGEVAYHSTLSGNGKDISFSHTDHRAVRLDKQNPVKSDIQHIEIVEGLLPEILHSYQEFASTTYPLPKFTPDWVREMTILEVYPPYYKDGFKEITARLPFYKKIGFNTIYLMPHWLGGYSPLDLYAVDPKYGTADDLKNLVTTAHQLGFKVLFDMVIHGFNKNSPLAKEKPDLFIHDPSGAIALHPTWKSLSTDWASPAYQQYMTDYVMHDLKTYDIDGYRVDAATFKDPSWDANIPCPAYKSGSDAPALLTKMLSAMRQKKPDAVFLSEVFGPLYQSTFNLTHDNQTEACQYFLEQMEAGIVTAWHYQQHIENVFSILPKGSNRVFYTRNHDTSWFYHFRGYKPEFMAMEAIHAFTGIPSVFAGDPSPKSQPSPDTDPAVYDYYQKLFAFRKAHPVLIQGDPVCQSIASNNPMVYVGLKNYKERYALFLVSLSRKPETVTITFSNKKAAPKEKQLQWMDVIENKETLVKVNDEKTFQISLTPCQVLETEY